MIVRVCVTGVPAPPQSSHDPDVPRVPRRRLSYRTEIWLTRFGIAMTIALATASTLALAAWLATGAGTVGPGLVIGQTVYVAGGAVMLFGSLVYLIARLGYLHRCRDFRPASAEELALLYDGRPPRLAVLVPSYREDPHLVRLTLLSAALQAFPRHRVVLLIDDPPNPDDLEARAQLNRVRELPGELQAALDEPARRLAKAREAFQAGLASRVDEIGETRRVAELWEEAAQWVESWASAFDPKTHVDRFFRREVLDALARQHRARAAELRERADHAPLEVTELQRAHRELGALFAVELTSFERKQWANLSHAPNKAMNLNSYLQLLGTSSRQVDGPDGLELVPDPAGEVHVADADYVISLDADSLLLPGYALRLVRVMEQPGNERVGLVQTPYSAFPDPPGTVERIAGATTDIMCLVHQGSTAYDAAYWVGANALVRVAALRDIAVVTEEGGRRITRFIQDRTLVEDTESTIDLIQHGWRLVNHPARLAYSATPPDFGSLLIQRRRWANGGLLVLPRFLRSWRGQRGGGTIGWLLRLNYITSLAAVNVAMIVLMAFPFEGVFAPVWLPLIAIPYFGLYARDLTQAGYRATDVIRVYALILLLIPVHLGGVVKSLWHGWTGRPARFQRTPTLPTRTPVPALYVLLTFLLAIMWMATSLDDLGHDRNGRAVFTALNVALLWYAVSRFLGFRAAIGDVWLRATGKVSRWATRPTTGFVRRRPLWRRPVALAGHFAMVPVLLVGGLTAHAWLQMENVEVDGLSSSSLGTMNVLVAGVDSREDVSAEERNELSLGDFEGSRADTLFILTVKFDRAAILAFPRDLYVERCDGSHGRINEAIEVDGPSCLVETVEEVSGIAIGHYIEIDVTGLVDIVDSVGGVEMTLDRPIRDKKAGAKLPAGRQRLTGAEALAFNRVRSIDDDLGRIGRQQEFVEALVREVADRALTGPTSIVKLVDSVSASLTVDSNTGPVDLARIGIGVSRASSRDQLITRMVPTRLINVGDQQLLTLRHKPAARLFEAFATGSV